MRATLTTKAALLFVMLASIPALATGTLLVMVNANAVRTSEQALQSAVLSELASSVDVTLSAAHDELRAAAEALAVQSEGKTEPSLDAVRSVLNSGKRLRAARWVIPEKHVDFVLFSRGDAEAPKATPGDLQHALELGRWTRSGSAGEVVLIRAIRMAAREGAQGFLIGSLASTQVDEYFASVTRARFGGQSATVALIDPEKRCVASYGSGFTRGESLAGLPLWQRLRVEDQAKFAVVRSMTLDGVPTLAGVQALGRSGFVVAMWRPETEAFEVLGTMVRRTGAAVFVSVVLALFLGVLAATRLTKPILRMARQAELIGERAWNKLKKLPRSSDELGQLAASLDEMSGALQTSEERITRDAKLQNDLGRYMSQPLVERIMQERMPLALGGRRVRISVLFSNIVAFTPMAENNDPERVVQLLNELYELLTEIVFRNGGAVDKFLGDGMMASWGALEDDELHAGHALQAAEDMMHFVRIANDDWERRLGTRIRLAIGVNSGECIAGNVGSSKRMEFTVIGDVVNVAARLEREADSGQILLTEATHDAAPDGFDYSFMGEHRFPGRHGYTRVYALEEPS